MRADSDLSDTPRPTTDIQTDSHRDRHRYIMKADGDYSDTPTPNTDKDGQTYTMSQKTSKVFLLELRQTFINFDNCFAHREHKLSRALMRIR